MKYLVFGLVLLFPIGQLARFPFAGTVIHLNDFYVLFVVLSWILLKRKNISKDKLFLPLCIWVGVMILSFLINITRFPLDKMIVSSLYIWRFMIYAGLYFVIKDLYNEHQTIERLMSLAVVIVAISGLLQFIFLPDVSFLKNLDWDDHYFRAISTFLDPGFTGIILVLGLILAVNEKALLRMILIYLAFVLTYSRASYLAFLTSFGTFSFYKKSVRVFIIAVVVLFITIPILPKSSGEGTKLDRENSILARLNNWKQTISVWQENPLFGVGFNTYKYVSNTSPESHSGGADSSLLLVLATTGMIGILAYLYLLKTSWDMGDYLYKASLAGVLVHSMFNNTLFYPWVMEWLWILLALKPTARTSKSAPA